MSGQASVPGEALFQSLFADQTQGCLQGVEQGHCRSVGGLVLLHGLPHRREVEVVAGNAGLLMGFPGALAHREERHAGRDHEGFL